MISIGNKIKSTFLTHNKGDSSELVIGLHIVEAAHSDHEHHNEEQGNQNSWQRGRGIGHAPEQKTSSHICLLHNSGFVLWSLRNVNDCVGVFLHDIQQRAKINLFGGLSCSNNSFQFLVIHHKRVNRVRLSICCIQDLFGYCSCLFVIWT